MNAIGIRRPSAVLFDWDNTLVDSWAVIHAALNETFTAMDHPNWTREETEARVRGSLRDTFPGMFGTAGRMRNGSFTTRLAECISSI
jgi:phosphoglycolate phosphatase